MSISINKFLQPSTPQFKSPTIYNWTDYYPKDLIKSDVGAYALRLLSREYKGNCLRVRRSTDNTESDIGFNNVGVLDTATLTTFCTGGQGFVKIWYDQSGYKNDAIQTTWANQPRIISGVVDDGLFFVSANSNYFKITNNNAMNLTISPFSICFVGKLIPNANFQYVFSKNTNSAEDIQYGVLFDGSSCISYINGSSRVSSGVMDVNKHIYLTTYDGATNKTFLDGVGKTPLVYASTPLQGSTNIQIGCRSNSVDGNLKIYFLNGNLNELFIYPTNIESDSSTIYLNAKKFHNIP